VPRIDTEALVALNASGSRNSKQTQQTQTFPFWLLSWDLHTADLYTEGPSRLEGTELGPVEFMLAQQGFIKRCLCIRFLIYLILILILFNFNLKDRRLIAW
jgi:hypothetical protein